MPEIVALVTRGPSTNLRLTSPAARVQPSYAAKQFLRFKSFLARNYVSLAALISLSLLRSVCAVLFGTVRPATTSPGKESRAEALTASTSTGSQNPLRCQATFVVGSVNTIFVAPFKSSMS